MGYLNGDTIAGNKLFIIPDATIFHFGILESNVHMAWMRTVAGRLKSDYSYSKTSFTTISHGLISTRPRRPELKRQPRGFWMHASCIPMILWPHFTMI